MATAQLQVEGHGAFHDCQWESLTRSFNLKLAAAVPVSERLASDSAPGRRVFKFFKLQLEVSTYYKVAGGRRSESSLAA